MVASIIEMKPGIAAHFFGKASIPLWMIDELCKWNVSAFSTYKLRTKYEAIIIHINYLFRYTAQLIVVQNGTGKLDEK